MYKLTLKGYNTLLEEVDKLSNSIKSSNNRIKEIHDVFNNSEFLIKDENDKKNLLELVDNLATTLYTSNRVKEFKIINRLYHKIKTNHDNATLIKCRCDLCMNPDNYRGI